MKYVEAAPLSDPETAARKLVEIANGVEALQDGRIYVELVNRPFLNAGGTPDQHRAALERAVSLGWLWRHESGTYMKFTPGRGGPVRLSALNSLEAPELPLS